MAGPTEDQLKAAAKKAYAAGDVAAAKRLIDAARKAGASQPAVTAAPDAMSPDMTGKMAGLSAYYQKKVEPLQYDIPKQSPAEVFMGNLANGVAFGFADEIGAGIGALLGDGTYESNLAGLRAQNERQKQDAPKSALAGELAGAVAMPLGGLKSTGKLGLDMVKGGATGAALSGLYGFGSGEGGFDQRAADARNAAMWGGGIGLAIPGLGALLQKGLNSNAVSKAIKKGSANALDSDALKAVAKDAYKAVDDAGVQISPSSLSTMVQDMLASMKTQGLRTTTGRELSPKAAGFADTAMDVATDPAMKAGIPFSEVETLRKLAQAPASDVTNKLDASLGSQAIGKIDEFIAKLSPGQVTSGSADDLGSLITAARSAYQKAAKSSTIDTVIEKADGYLGGSASGIRNQFGTMLKNPKKYLKGFTPLEIEAMKRVVNGSPIERAIVLAGSGLGRLASAGAGAGLGGIPGLIAGGAIGSGVQKLADNIVGKKAETLRALVANGGKASLPQVSSNPRWLTEALLQRFAASGVNH